MATFKVTNTNDSGAGSLRDAIAQAEASTDDDDKIVFAKKLSGETIRLASMLSISNDTLTIDGDIDGNGTPDIIVSGDTDGNGTGDTRLLNTSGTVTINGIWFDRGLSTGFSGYIINNGSGDTLSISNSYITNTVVNGTGGFVGTIRNAGDLNLSNVLMDNTVVNLSGSNTAGASGIANFAGSTATIRQVGITGSATSANTSFVVLGANNYGGVTGGILATGDGDTGEDGTGLVNRFSGSGSVIAGISGTLGADNFDFSAASADLAILTFRGKDVVRTGSGSDTVYSGAGKDTLKGGAGADKLVAQQGDDIIRGGNGADTLLGKDDDDRMFGGKGSDKLKGGLHDDLLVGNAGNDTLIGNKGSDTLKGGAGADRFQFKAADGWNLVTDFQNGVDKIVAKGAGGFGGLTITRLEGDALIRWGSTSVRLDGVDPDLLDPGDFLF